MTEGRWSENYKPREGTDGWLHHYRRLDSLPGPVKRDLDGLALPSRERHAGGAEHHDFFLSLAEVKATTFPPFTVSMTVKVSVTLHCAWTPPLQVTTTPALAAATRTPEHPTGERPSHTRLRRKGRRDT
jgi:hypothetical protein